MLSGAIALRPTGNTQGSYYFLNLYSIKCAVRNNWTVLSRPTKVISRIHQLAAACTKYKDIVLIDKYGNTINYTHDPYTETDETCPYNNNIEITWVDENELETDTPIQTGQVTGVETDDTEQNRSARQHHDNLTWKMLIVWMPNWQKRTKKLMLCWWQHILKERIPWRSLCNNQRYQYNTRNEYCPGEHWSRNRGGIALIAKWPWRTK